MSSPLSDAGPDPSPATAAGLTPPASGGPGVPDRSRSTYARLAGLGYLVIIVTGIYAEFFVRGSLVVPGDAAETAGNIAASELLFRTGLVAEFAMLSADVFVALALYVVFRAVSRNLALLAAFFRLSHASIVGLNLLLTWVPLLLVGGAGYVAAIPGGQRDALVLLALDAHAYGYTIGLVFFAVHCLVLGMLVLRASDVPRILGFLLLMAGAGYLIDSLAQTLLTTYGDQAGLFASIVFIPAFVGELSFALWLLVKGGSLRPIDPAREEAFYGAPGARRTKPA